MTREKIQLLVEVGFLRIAAAWSLRVGPRGYKMAFPEVDQFYRSPERSRQGPGYKPLPGRRPTSSEIDGWEMTTRFLGLKHTEEEALKFLNDVGVWTATEDPQATAERDGKQFINGYFGARLFTGRAEPILLDGLWKQQSYWNDTLSKRARLMDEFGPAPRAEVDEIQHYLHAWMSHQNELRLHTEWRRTSSKVAAPISVIETITGYELLLLTSQLNVLRSGGTFHVCKCCGATFPILAGHKKLFCCWNCAHVVAERRRRKREKTRRHRAKTK
jgi:hypothetical protein